MKKRHLALLFLLIFTAGIFVGCGGKETTGTQEGEITEESTPENNDITLEELINKGKNVSGISYDLVISTSEGQLSGKVWMQGDSMKTDMTVSGQRVINIVNGETSEAFVYMPDQNMAMKIPIDQVNDQGGQTPQEVLGEVDPEVYSLGEKVELDGVMCRLITYESPEGNTKIWVREEYGVPVKIEITAGDVVNTVEYKNLVVGEIPADTFEIPADVQVTSY